jgi:RNA polymerase sigma factor (sigma-70 family)
VPPGDLGPPGDGEATRSIPGGPPAQAAMMAGVCADLLDLFESEFHQVIRFLMYFGASFPEAEDATQEAFCQAWQKLTRNPEKWAAVRNPRAWIRTVAYRKYQRPPGPRRHLATLPTDNVPDTAQPGPDHADLTAGTLLVLDALHALEPRERAVMAYHLDGFNGPETASALGITGQQARDALKKARKILAARLEAPGNRSGGPARAH